MKRFVWIGPLVWLIAAACADAVVVSGTVREAITGGPIEGALVSLQAAGVRTSTASDGTYSIDLPNGVDLVLVAAAKGFFNSSLVITPPATNVDFSLEAVPQDDDPNYQIVSPSNCGMCHPDQFMEWTGSPMAQAGLNTWVADIYNGTGTPGGLGGFVYTRDSRFAASHPASECAACHQPELWINNPFTALEDPMDPPSDSVVHGISCEVCHKIADMNVVNINFPGLFPGLATFTRPAGTPLHQVQYGVLADTDFVLDSFMRPSYQPQLVAEVCGACHQDKNDLHENQTFDGVTSEPTYLEWRESAYSDPSSPHFATCVDCHMSASDATTVCDVLFPPLERTGVKRHDILGTTPAYLDNAVELQLQAQLVGDRIEVTATIDNNLTGHHVPTGVTIRNMILLIEAWPAGGDPLADALPFVGSQTVDDLGGVGDPAQGYYAGLPGKLFAKVNHDADGNGPTFFTDATGIQFDNRIPALTEDVSTYAFQAPLGGGAVRVRARLIYRRSFRFLLDAKQWSVNGHGQPLEDVQPPNFGHLMESAELRIDTPALGACCIVDGTCRLASETACTSTAGGAWAGTETNCSDNNGDGRADACASSAAIPTVSTWGLVIMTLALLSGARIMGRRQRIEAT